MGISEYQSFFLLCEKSYFSFKKKKYMLYLIKYAGRVPFINYCQSNNYRQSNNSTRKKLALPPSLGKSELVCWLVVQG